MICPYCKAEIEDGSQKCKNCGEWVNNIFPEREFGKTIAFAFFFGIFGVHRFHTGYKKIGIIQLVLTLTLFGVLVSGIWVFVDLMSIAFNNYKDSLNRPLLHYKKNFGITIAIIVLLCAVYNIWNAIEGWNMVDSKPSAPVGNTQTPAKTSERQVGADFVPDSNTPKTLILLENHECVGEFGTKAICGTILNNSDRNLSYAEVSVNLYDASGATIGSNLDNINDLEAGKKWKFEITITTDRPVANYKISGISGY